MVGMWWCVLAAVVTTASSQSSFTLEEFVTGQFTQRGFTGVWISDTEFTYTIAGEPGIHMFNVQTLTSSVLVAGDLMAFLNTNNPILSADRAYILAPSEVQQVYRYSTTAKFALYNIATATSVDIANGQRLQLCIFGGGHSLAYVLNNNVYYLPENRNQAIQLTNDGIPGVIYNGHTDWVYEEDVMYTGQATWFSRDGSYLAFATFNDTEVESYSYYYFVDKSNPDDLYPELVDLKYPKVGRTNPTAVLRVVNLRALVENNNFNFITVEPPEEVTADHILGGVVWPTDNEIAVHWLNRRQNKTVLRICNVVTWVCENEHREQPNGWVPIALPRFSSGGDFYVSTRWSFPQADGNIWQHLYVSMRVAGQIISSSITPGAFTVNNFVGMDEQNLAYYYTRTVTDMPWRTQLHVAGANIGCLSCDLVLPDGGPCTWATATASRGGSYLTVTCSSPNEPSATYIINPRTRETLYVWEDNAIVRQRLIGKTRPGSIITTVPLENGFPAPVRLHLPPGLDVNDHTTKYPMVFYVYSGPNTNTVFDTFTVGYHSYLTTSRNMIYMVADGRGSGLKGQDILYSLNNALGTVEIEDHFVILKEVLNRYGFIDRDRIGMWGHSYGGYATLLTLVHDNDHMFQCGVSGAPVTSWLYYNTMYTERYMGLPTPEDNLSGYEAGDVTLLVDKLAGHDFYIMHGNADDNVHYQNAAKLMRALQEKDIPFEQMAMEQAVFLLMGLICHTQSSAYIQGQKIFSLEEIVPLMAEFYPERMSVQWISDTTYIYKDPGGIKKYDASTDKVVTILNEIELYNLSNYTLSTFSEDGKYVLLTKNRRKIYRYSFLAEYSVLDIEKRLIYKLSDYPLQVVVWGIGKSVAYVQDNNVYYVPDITQADYVGVLTTGGVPGEVYFGATDWIYEEEIFNAAEALWFSPGGTYLAVASFNDTNVESAVFPYYGDPGNINNQYPQMVQFKYPKVGRTNPRVGLRVYKLDEPNSEPWSIPAPVDVIGLDNILGRVNWASDQNLIVLWLNRRQSISILINCDLQKDKCSIVKEHTEPNGWIDINDPIFDKTGTKMVEIQPLYHAERRFPHAARVDFNTLTTEDLSPGNSTVLEIVGWNQDTNTVYYIVAPGNLPWLRQIWATSGGVVRCISCKEPTCRHVSAMFSPGANYAIVTCSACNIPPKIYLYDAKKETFKLIKDNKKLIDTLQMYQLPLTHFIAMSIGNEVNANVKLILPAGIKQGEQYAMVVRVYAGPGTTRVRDNYDLEYYNSYLATNRSIIVASIDVRGSGVMGVEAMHAVNRALGTVEISDTLDTIKSLTSLYSFIDPDRIGVWGWSYGGYATTMMLIQDQRNIVKCGAAVAPVTSWLYYDSIYTERYMDTPQANPLGYERSDLTNLAEGLRGRKYLLVHGSGDDNVHYQHSMQLAKRLQHSDIAFEQMSYTDENHSLMGVSRHFYHTLDRFWSECFKL